MYTPDDRDIDKLSREAAEHYQAPGMPDWNKLQQSLDKELPVEKEKKRRGFLFFFLIATGLLLGGGLWFGGTLGKRPATADATTHAPGKSSAEQQHEIVSAKTGDQTQPATAGTNKANSATTGSSDAMDAPLPGASKTDQASNSSADREKPGAKLTNRDHGIPGESITIAGSDVFAEAEEQRTRKEKSNKFSITTVSGPIKTTRQNTGATDRNLTAKHNRNEKPGRKAQEAIHGSATGDDTNSNGVQSNNTAMADAPSDVSKKADAPAVANDNSTKTPAVAATSTKSQPADSNTTAKSKAGKKNTKSKTSFIAAGLSLGTDISTVKFTHGDNPGYSAGINLGYGFNSKWAVYTGLAYTKKNYTLNGKDYHPPTHYWTQYVNLQTVSGDCQMLEIPLSAVYTINPSAKNAFFVGAGISSYLMKKQNYVYNYKNNMGQAMSSPWSNDSTFKHYFSVLDLSAGVTRRLGKHVVANIEPYARIPLGGVGFGNIRLSSFGLNFSVQYRQPVKR